MSDLGRLLYDLVGMPIVFIMSIFVYIDMFKKYEFVYTIPMLLVCIFFGFLCYKKYVKNYEDAKIRKVFSEDISVVKEALKLKVDINHKDVVGYTALMKACKKNFSVESDYELVKFLIDSNSDVNIINDKKL